MNTFLNPFLELAVIIPGMLLAYRPVKTSLSRLIIWLIPLLSAISLLGGLFCYRLNLSTAVILFPLLPALMLLYHKTLHISIWKSGSVFLAVCAVFACVNSLSRAVSALLTSDWRLHAPSLWFCTKAGIFYNLICWIFVLAVWYPASHTVQTMISDENFAQTWYIFWIIPLLFIGLNLFMVPRYRSTLYTGRILQGYIVISLVLLLILALIYTMFLLMAMSLNRNARLQQENHFLSLQQERYDSLCTAIEETRQARHDIRHHVVRLSALADSGDLAGIKDYLRSASGKIPDLDMHFCENRAADSVIGYYCTLAGRSQIPFDAQIDLPEVIGTDEIDMCLVLSNLLENALEASLKTNPARRKITVLSYMHSPHLLLIQVENPFDEPISEKGGIFQSSKRAANGIGIQSVRRIAEKNGGASTFTYDNHVFCARIMLRMKS